MINSRRMAGQEREQAMRAEELKRQYNLEKHVEGGWFAEYYTAPFKEGGRPLAGSIYFLLDRGEISHFHQIDCDEIWYYHEGCGMKITVLTENGKQEILLGADCAAGERAAAVIPKGAAFAAENLKEDGFTFVSCVTTPAFAYEGFRLLNAAQIKEKYGDIAAGTEDLAYEGA
jgi:predicted cupin superfamily sugar epimerase